MSALVSGRVMPHGDTIEVSAELTDVRDNTEIWGHHYSGKSADIISLQQQIAGDIAGKLRSKLSTSERQQVTKQGTQNPEAYALYLKGRYSWNKRTPSDIADGNLLFQSSHRQRPRLRIGVFGSGRCLCRIGHHMVALPAKTIRSRMPPPARRWSWTRPWLIPMPFLGSNEMEYDWDFAGGEAEFKKAFELDPNDATAHQWYALDIGRIGGREQEALAEVNRAHQLDPLSPIISVNVGFIHIMARQYDDAIAVCKKLADENPTFAVAHSCLAQAYWGKQHVPTGH